MCFFLIRGFVRWFGCRFGGFETQFSLFQKMTIDIERYRNIRILDLETLFWDWLYGLAGLFWFVGVRIHFVVYVNLVIAF